MRQDNQQYQKFSGQSEGTPQPHLPSSGKKVLRCNALNRLAALVRHFYVGT
jgi:hypothetical protein